MQFLLTYMHWLATRITVLYEHLPERERGLRLSHNISRTGVCPILLETEKNKN